MQEQENSKNQEVQDNHTMTKLQDVFNLAHDQALLTKSMPPSVPIRGYLDLTCGY